MNEEQRTQLGQSVKSARLRRGLAKEAAARDAEVSSITLKRIEDGLSVREDSLAKVLGFFDLPMPGLNLETPVRPENVDRIRALIEADETLSPATRARLLGVLDERGEANAGTEPTRTETA